MHEAKYHLRVDCITTLNIGGAVFCPTTFAPYCRKRVHAVGAFACDAKLTRNGNAFVLAREAVWNEFAKQAMPTLGYGVGGLQM
jgi:hypothetical protein